MNEELHTEPLLSHESVADRVQQAVRQAEEYARREPAKAAAAAFGAGILLNVLPTRFIVGTLTAIAVPFVRPALLTLGFVKACELCCTPASERETDD